MSEQTLQQAEAKPLQPAEIPASVQVWADGAWTGFATKSDAPAAASASAVRMPP